MNITKFNLDLSDYVSGKLIPELVTGKWISNSEMITEDFNIWNLITGDLVSVLTDNLTRLLKPQMLELSNDRKFALVLVKGHAVWRNSVIGKYVLVDLTTNLVQSFPELETSVRLISWAPTGNSLVYVNKENNIFYRDSAYSNKSVQLTTEGVEDVVYCGIPDWVYEEEVLSSSQAIWWSPSSKKLAYAVFDDSQVSEYSWNHYGKWKNVQNLKNQYPRVKTIHYPKAGSRNPTVSLWIAVFSQNGSVFKFRVENPSISAEPILTRVLWISNSSLISNWMNRVQNRSITLLCQVATELKCTKVFKTEEKNGWVEMEMNFTPNPVNNGTFLYLAPERKKDRFHQIFIYENGKARKITHHQGEINEILKFKKNGDIFYTGVYLHDRKSKHLFRTQKDGSVEICVTCRFKHECEYFEPSISTEGQYAILNCLGPHIPYSKLLDINTMEIKATLKNNTKLQKLHSPPLSHRIHLHYGKTNVELMLPSGVTLKSDVELPTILYVYGGPGSQEVLYHWYDDTVLLSYLVETKGFIGIKIDARGSGNAGATFMMSNYRNLGTKEVDEIISIVKRLQTQYKIIDSKRTGVYGWSFGGYFSLSVLARDSNGVFSCGVSVAPVSMWELYDSIYTERYMSTPQDNYEGYNKSTPLWKLENLRNKSYLVLHGTEDDNVHFQQSMFIVQELEKQNILFDQVSYPDQDHGIGVYLEHVMHTVSEFFIQKFK
ncbi:venom dipeptidyl peptidase 4 isoform X3 [Eurytemora carolleeae]|nr:venom dipeptidyl peptidase 4 isoform X3 [Eurytemora carolleeae]|eukprot:XP_023344643.1 venom dipeptidyl peptidase 4-like isoform X3 [Eurytemora affinis]